MINFKIVTTEGLSDEPDPDSSRSYTTYTVKKTSELYIS